MSYYIEDKVEALVQIIRKDDYTFWDDVHVVSFKLNGKLVKEPRTRKERNTHSWLSEGIREEVHSALHYDKDDATFVIDGVYLFTFDVACSRDYWGEYDEEWEGSHEFIRASGQDRKFERIQNKNIRRMRRAGKTTGLTLKETYFPDGGRANPRFQYSSESSTEDGGRLLAEVP